MTALTPGSTAPSGSSHRPTGPSYRSALPHSVSGWLGLIGMIGFIGGLALTMIGRNLFGWSDGVDPLGMWPWLGALLGTLAAAWSVIRDRERSPLVLLSLALGLLLGVFMTGELMITH